MNWDVIKDAISAYDHALTVDPRHAKVYYNKGIALADLNRHNDAILAYDKAIEIVPNYAKAYYNKGISLYDIGKYDDALDAFNKAIRNRSYRYLGMVLPQFHFQQTGAV